MILSNGSQNDSFSLLSPNPDFDLGNIKMIHNTKVLYTLCVDMCV